jgi:hypothetical protein
MQKNVSKTVHVNDGVTAEGGKEEKEYE